MMFERRDQLSIGDYKIDPENFLDIPVFDHCQFDCLPSLSMIKRIAFQEALFRMDWNKKEDREVMISEVYICIYVYFYIFKYLWVNMYDIDMANIDFSNDTC